MPSALPLTPESRSTLALLRLEQQRVRQARDRSGQRIAEAARTLLAPGPKATNKVDMVLTLLHNGLSIAKGVQTGISIIAAVRSLLGISKRRK